MNIVQQYLLPFIVLLGLLIFVHEFGHFLMAKLFGVRVLKFSLGFGPKLIGKKIGDTEYLISAFPLGGYVKMLGEQPLEEVSSEEERLSFSSKPVWQRFIIVAGGPFFNLLFAVIVFFLLFAATGLPQLAPGTKIGGVSPDSAAERAGLQINDIILSINGQDTKEWEDVSELVGKSGGLELALSIERDGEVLEVTGKPELRDDKNLFGEVIGQRFMLGIERSQEVYYEKISIPRAFLAGINQTVWFGKLTIVGIFKMLQRVVPASELGGPILIAKLTGQQMQAGWASLARFMGLLSVNLGILNLFPIPILDGGHLVFFSVEAIRRKPLSLKAQEILQQVGLVVLLSLMLFVFYNDILKFW